MASKIKSWLILALKIAVAAGLVIFMVKYGNLRLDTLWDLMTPRNIIIALCLVGSTLLFSAWRWIILLRAQGFQVSFFYGLSLFMIGCFFNFALPGAVGGDVVKGYYLLNDFPQRRLDGALSVLLDRVIGLYSFFILTLLAALSDYEFVMGHEQVRWVVGLCLVIFLGMTIFFCLSFSTRLYRHSGLSALVNKINFAQRVMGALQHFGKNRSAIIGAVLVSVLGQISSLLFFYQIGPLLGEPDITWRAVLFAVPMGFVVTAVPIAPAGIGVGQVAFHYLFQVYLGHDTSFGATAVTAFQLTNIAWALVGGLLYIRRKPVVAQVPAVAAS